MNDPHTLRFVLNGEAVAVAGVPPATTLLDWLRYQRRLVGTKEGCAEGDCGACTVALRVRRPDGRVETRAVNACITLLPMVHGREVVTVEGIAGAGGALHPVQRAMVDAHASQCGFCTPGFVMSLWAAHEDPPPAVAPPPAGAPAIGGEAIDDILAGNLCRCTGYGPIVTAAAEAARTPRPARAAPDGTGLAAVAGEETLDYRADGRRFIAPARLDDLADAIAEHPDATILSGATDVGLWVTKRGFDPETIVHTGRCAELAAIRREGDALVIGAGALNEAARAAVAPFYPDMGELLRRFGGRQVRSSGTIGGNIANGSPIGDWAPALIAAGATVRLRHRTARREIPLEDFFIAYGKQDRRPGEFVEAVRLPLPGPDDAFRCYKVSKRFDSDITAVLAAIALTIRGGVVTAARLAFGGTGPTPARARAAERALLGRPFDAAAVEAARAALERDLAPISDLRASAGYRMRVAGNLIERARIELADPAVPTRLAGPAAAKALA